MATSDIVGIITAPPDEAAEMRFPRPPMAPSGNEQTNGNQSNSNNTNSQKGTGSNNSGRSSNGAGNGNSRPSRSKPPSGKQTGGLVSSESWDDLDDLLEAATVNGGDDQSDNGRKEFNYKAATKGSGSARQSNMSSSNHVTSESNHYVAETYREASRDYLQHSGSAGTPGKPVSGMKLGGDQFSAGSSTKSNMSGHNSVDSLTDSVKSSNISGTTMSKRNAAAPSPVGDDFFATFGI